MKSSKTYLRFTNKVLTSKYRKRRLTKETKFNIIGFIPFVLTRPLTTIL